MSRSRPLFAAPVTAIALLVPATLFWLTLYPGVGGRLDPGASANLQFVGRVLGVPEAPGYPQYVLISYLWTALPLPGSLAVQVNALSMACALVAAAILFAATRRITGDGIAALLALWVVLFSESVWTLSTEASTAALHLVYVAAVLGLGGAWLRTRRPAWLSALLLVYGLGFGNDTSLIVLLPAIILLVVWAPPPRPRALRLALTATAAAIAGVGQYALVWWRSHADAPYLAAVPENASLAEVRDAMLSAAVGVGDILGTGVTNLTLDVLIEANAQLLFPAVMVAAWGFVTLRRTDRTLAWFWGLAWLAQVLRLSAYDPGLWSTLGAPLWLITGVFLAVGLARANALRDGLALGALGGVVASLAWTVAGNFAALRVPESPYDLTALIGLAGPDGTVVTHDRSNYRDDQIADYFRLGLDTASTGPRLLTATDLLTQPRLLLADRPIHFRDRSGVLHTDLVPVSPVGDIAGWVRSLPDGTLVAVIATDTESPAALADVVSARRQIADALESLHIGAPLRAAAAPLAWYVALAVKGSSGAPIELTHPTDAILGLPDDPDGESRLRAFFAAHPGLPDRPQPFELYAGRAAEGIFNRLRLGDREDLSRAAEIRIFAIEPTADPDYQVLRFDSESGAAIAPYYYVSGTIAPATDLSIIGTESGAPTLARGGRPLITDEAPDMTVAVVGCRQQRVKVARTFSLAPGTEDLRELRRLARNTPSGDWLILATTLPATAGAQRNINSILERNELPAFDWQLVERNAVILGRVRTTQPQSQVVPDPVGNRTVELPCEPTD